MKTSVTKDQVGDTVYLNISMSNPEDSTIERVLNYSTTLRNPVVDDPSLYDLAIERFSIPGKSLPLFYFQTQGFPQTNVNVGTYSVVIGYQGNYTAPVHLILIPETTASPQIPTFTAQSPQQDPQDTYYYVQSYVNLANMVTTALRTAIAAGVGFLPGGVDAYMIFTSNGGKYSLLGTSNMASSANPADPNNVQIYLSSPLANFFTSFKLIHNSYNAANGRDELILIENDRNNIPATQDGFNPNIPAGYIQMQQEFNSDSSLETLTRIIITSNSFGGVLAQNELSDQPGGTYANVIADFVPAASTQNGSYQGKYQYFVQSELITRVLTSHSPLVEINLNFYWQGIRPSVIRPLHLVPGDTASLLAALIRKR